MGESIISVRKGVDAEESFIGGGPEVATTTRPREREI